MFNCWETFFSLNFANSLAAVFLLMSSFGKCNVNTEDIWETKNPENGESESGFIMSLFCLSYIINLKLGQASYAITNEICNDFF